LSTLDKGCFSPLSYSFQRSERASVIVFDGKFRVAAEMTGIEFWGENHVDDIRLITPMHVAAYIEQHPGSPQTIKQHLAAIKMLFDYLVISQIVPTNPAAPVKGPTHIVKRGKTPVLSVEDARTLLDSISLDSLQGLRDRAVIGVMLFLLRGFRLSSE
jgi:site-specific recombinase XerD